MIAEAAVASLVLAAVEMKVADSEVANQEENHAGREVKAIANGALVEEDVDDRAAGDRADVMSVELQSLSS